MGTSLSRGRRSRGLASFLLASSLARRPRAFPSRAARLPVRPPAAAARCGCPRLGQDRAARGWGRVGAGRGSAGCAGALGRWAGPHVVRAARVGASGLRSPGWHPEAGGRCCSSRRMEASAVAVCEVMMPERERGGQCVRRRAL